MLFKEDWLNIKKAILQWKSKWGCRVLGINKETSSLDELKDHCLECG